MLAEKLSGSVADKLYVDDVFSTFLYTGNGSTQTINNGISLVSTAPWFAGILSQGSGSSKSVVVDLNGDIVISGVGTISGNSYSALSKHSPDGAIIWQRKLSAGSGIAGDFGSNVAVDSSGNIYICFDPGGNSGLSVAKYNTSGSIQWQRKLVQAGSFGRGIAVSSGGNVYIVGTTAPSGNHTTIAKYNTSGTIQWQRKLAIGDSYGIGIAIDSSENVYVDSYITDGGAQKNIAKFNTSGTIQWQRNVLGAASGSFNSITATTSGDVYAVGSTHILKYNTSGTNQWQRRITTSSFVCVAVDTSGNVYAGGNDSGFGSITKYDTSGNIQWRRSFASGGTCYDITTDTSGNIYAVGITATNQGFFVSLKQDGTVVGGTANSIFMMASAATDLVGNATLSTGSATESASTATESADTTTDSAGTLTYSVEIQNAITSTGGLVWIKGRSGATAHALYDTARGATFDLALDAGAQATQATGLTAFNSNGFSLGALAKLNTNAATYASWTFRKAPKFFDVVTWSGNGTTQTIAHSLGQVPGIIIVQPRSNSGNNAYVWHRSLGANDWLIINRTDAADSVFASQKFGNNSIAVAPTSTLFTVGQDLDINGSGRTYVAYLFAHDAAADGLIQCGTYAGNSGERSINLGWEPQFVMLKSSDSNAAWLMYDTMRGMANTASTQRTLQANGSSAEYAQTIIYPTATGFNISGTGSSEANLSPYNYIYLAIRRPNKPPTVGTQVYNGSTSTATTGVITSGFATDMVMTLNTSGSTSLPFSRGVLDRLRGAFNNLATSATSAEANNTSTVSFDQSNGIRLNAGAVYSAGYFYPQFKRAPGVFDVVCYTGTGANRTVAHSLGVAPELVIVKKRNDVSNWHVYAESQGNTKYAYLNNVDTFYTGSTVWNNTSPTASVFTVGTSLDLNHNTQTYVAYLFATKAGISKVGSYTGNGSSQTIDCGFTTGARFILIKRTDSTGDWFVWDIARGIVAGNDPHLSLNTNVADVTTDDSIDPDTSGFIVNQLAATNINVNAATYIYLAFA